MVMNFNLIRCNLRKLVSPFVVAVVVFGISGPTAVEAVPLGLAARMRAMAEARRRAEAEQPVSEHQSSEDEAPASPPPAEEEAWTGTPSQRSQLLRETNDLLDEVDQGLREIEVYRQMQTVPVSQLRAMLRERIADLDSGAEMATRLRDSSPE